MLLEETKARLLTSSETPQNLLNLISDLYVQEIHSKEAVLVTALSELHNSGVIDFVKLIRGTEKNSCGRNYFNILNVFENALPTLDSNPQDVLHCLVHLQQQSDKDLAFGGIYSAFERYCSEESHRPRESVRIILAQGEVNEYALFLSNSILAFDSDCVMEAIELTKRLISNKNEIIRNQAYLTLGRLSVDQTKADSIWDLISKCAVKDNDCSASLLRAILQFGEKFPSYWPQIEELLSTFLENRSEEILYMISNIVTFQNFDLPKSIFHLMVMQLTNVSHEHKRTIDNIDNLLVILVEKGEASLAILLLESILTAGIKFKELDYFSYELIKKHHELRNHIITKWLLNGDIQLCHGILDLINGSSDEKIELKAEKMLLDNQEKQLFVSHKVIGWLFTRPIAAASFIISITDFSSEDTTKKLESILFYPLLLSYPGELKEYFNSYIEDKNQEELFGRLLGKYNSYHCDIEKASEIKELKGSNENLIAYWRNFEKTMQDAHEEASKSSIIRMLAKTQIVLYGNSSIYYIHQGDGRTERQEMQMHTFSHSTEMPRLNILDPISLDYFLMICRHEKIKR